MARSRKTKERKTKEKPPGSKRPIEQYDHKGQQRKNNPHLDPTLTWASKAEHTSTSTPTPGPIA